MRRFNRYNCACGNSILSEDVDRGVTPFMLPCGACGSQLTSEFYLVTEPQDSTVDIEWYSPSTEEQAKLTRPMREHVEQGGLVYRVVSDRPAVHHLRVLQQRQWIDGPD